MSDKEGFQPYDTIPNQERETFCVFQEVEYELHTLQQDISFSPELQENNYPPEIEKLFREYPGQEETIQSYREMLNNNQAVFYDDTLLIKVVLIFAKQCPIDLLEYYDAYKEKPYAKKLLKEIKQSVNYSDSKDIMQLCKQHGPLFIKVGEKEFIKGLLKKVFKESYGGYDLLHGFGNYGEILIEAGELEFIKDLLQGVVQKKPFGASHVMRLFEDYGPLLITFGERAFIKDLLTECLKKDLQIDTVIDGFQSYGQILIDEGYLSIVKNLLKGFLEEPFGVSYLTKKFEKYGPVLLTAGEEEFVITLLYSLGDEQPGFFMNNFDYERNKESLGADLIDPIMDRFTLKLFEGAFSESISKELLIDVKKSVQSLHLPGGSILHLKPCHINMYSGLLKTYLAHKKKYDQDQGAIDWDAVKRDYEMNMNSFIEQGKQWSEKTKDTIHVFMVRASKKAGDDKNNSLTYSSEKLKKVYKDKFALGGTFYDYSSDSNPQSAKKILDAFEKNIEKHPEDKHLFHIGGHGGVDGSISLKGGKREKKHFERLLTIKTKNPNSIKIDISSCNSGYKDESFYDNTIKNLSLNSVRHSSFGGKDGSDDTFLEAFELRSKDGKLVADYDGDDVVNFNEALLYRNIRNNSSLAMTMSDDGQGGIIDISMLLY